MRPKVILQLYPMLPADGEEGRRRARPVGRDADLYQRVLFEWLDIIKAADEMGVWGASTIEHHLHSEGYEVGPNPGILNAWWAGQVKNMHVGALGYVMATQDPIRVAEETAILDHITRGKYFVGFARGYQSRWTNILGQFSNTVATVSDGSADDLKNRDIFEERVAMVLRCWEEDSVVLDGNYYQAPFPLDTGVREIPGGAHRPRGRRSGRDRRRRQRAAYQRGAADLPEAPPADLRRHHEERRLGALLRPQRLHPDLLLEVRLDPQAGAALCRRGREARRARGARTAAEHRALAPHRRAAWPNAIG